MKREIIFLSPVFKHMIWGGNRIRTEFDYDVRGEDIGECWGIAAHPNGDSLVCAGEFAGLKLSELWNAHRELFGNLPGDKFPLLVKIIDAKSNLSIQVHPGDDYARKYENASYGKTECWYMIDCPEDAELIIGHNAKTKDEMKALVYGGEWDAFLRKLKVKKGDIIQIDPGTIHAITAGCLLLETQQNSDITYRLYDYDRLVDGKKRELHIDKSLDVITVPAISAEQCKKTTEESVHNQMKLLFKNDYYKIFKLSVNGMFQFEQSYPFLNMSVIEGEAVLNDHLIKKGNHFILPCDYGNVLLQGDATIIASTV